MNTQQNSRAVPQMPVRAYFAMAAGLVAISLASIFIRFAQEEDVPSLVIAAGRLTIAAMALTPFALARYGTVLRSLDLRAVLLAVASGTLLAFHFATWIASLEYTSVLISVVFVTTSPLWVAVLETVFLRVQLRLFVASGLAVALIGGSLIGLGGDAIQAGANPTLGGGLALSGAITIAVYLVIGRKLRADLDLLPYIWLVYSCAAVVLIVMVGLTRTPVLGYSTSGYLWIAALALVPQLIGHSSLNYALRYLSATFVGIATQMEPIGSAIAAFIIFREQPTGLQLLGSLSILVGVALASIGQQQSRPAESEARLAAE